MSAGASYGAAVRESKLGEAARQVRVCVALPVYNGARTLDAAIGSIVGQSLSGWRLLVVDDGSEDASVALARRWAERDPRIEVLADGLRLGIASRLNQAADRCSATYFARMDADDVSFPSRLERQVEYLDTHPDVGLLGTRVLRFDDSGRAVSVSSVAEDHDQICARPWQGFPLAHPTWMGRTELFRQVRYRPKYNGAEDQDFLYRASRMTRFACLAEIGLAYRVAPRPWKVGLRRRMTLFRALFGEALTSGAYYTALRALLHAVAVAPLRVNRDHVRLTAGTPVAESLDAEWKALQRAVGPCGS